MIVGVGVWAHLNNKLPPQIQEVTDDIQEKVEKWLEPGDTTTPEIAPVATLTATSDTTALSTPNVEMTSVSAAYPLAEELVANRINQFRANRGLSILAYNSSLADVARAHSEDMANRDFFDHVNPDGVRAHDRVELAGLTDFACGENLHMVTNATEDDAEHIASDAFTGWLNSPGHYENMVDPSYDTGGVGVFVRSQIMFLDRAPRRYDIYSSTQRTGRDNQ